MPVSAADWVVTIPSYRRADICNSQTLTCLAEGGVPRDRVFVGVVEEEADEYARRLDPALYDDLVVYPRYNNMAGACMELQRQFTPGNVVQFDDDVRAIERKLDDKTLEPVTDLPELFTTGFQQCIDRGFTLWGIYPARNPMFMKSRISTRLCLCVGHCFGHILSGRACEQSTASAKNDYERCLQHYMADGGLVRFDYICARSKVYNQPGGLQGIRDDSMAIREADDLMRRFPGMVKPKKAKSGHYEIRLVSPT